MEALGLEDLQTLIRRNPDGNDKIMLPWGGDEYLPTQTSQEIEKRIRLAASKVGIPIKTVLLTTPSRYFQDVAKSRVALPTYTYDFNPLLVAHDLRGIWGQRPKLKIAERRSEDALESSEKLASIASLYGQPYPLADFERAWQWVLSNQVHDTMGGSHSDEVYDIAMSRYGGALEAGRQAEADALFHLSRQIDTSRSGDFPIVVFNTLSFQRTELVRITRTLFQETWLSNKEVKDFRVVDPEGNAVPFRVVAASRTADYAELTRDAGLSMVEIEFLATQVPALGYRVYRIEPKEGSLPVPHWHPIEGEVSNRFFTLGIDPASGSISKLVDRRSGKTLLAPGRYGGNELVLEEEKNPHMEGMIHFTGGEIRASQTRPESITMLADGLGTTVRIEGSFLGGRRIQEIKLYEQLPRIDFRTELKSFPGRDGMLTAVFPIPRRAGTKARHETHNAVVERPDGIYFAHTWVDLPNSDGGLAILNRGTGGNQIEGGEARLILLRSLTHFVGYHTPQAAEAGDHEFEYSLYPHSGDWGASDVMEQAHSINSPLRVISTDAHEGSLPTEHSFLSIQDGHFEVTALKKAEQSDEFILRGHETQGKAGLVRLQVGLPVQQAWFADLLERPGHETAVVRGSIAFDCQPFEFVTLRLKMEPLNQ